MTKLLMFEVDVKYVMEGRREGKGRREGPAWVWGSDFTQCRYLIMTIARIQLYVFMHALLNSKYGFAWFS